MSEQWHIASMERLGASIQELAEEQYQELMGFEGEGGHRAPRTDIAKLKALWQMRENARGTETGRGPSDPEDYGKGVAKIEWDKKTQMTADEYELLKVYSYALNKTMGPARDNPQVAFEQAVLVMSGEMSDWQRYVVNAIGGSYQDMKDLKPIYTEQEAKSLLGSAQKKQQIADAPSRYEKIYGALNGLKKYYPESYKLWPWAVSQLKAIPTADLISSHFMDVVGEAGKVMNDLRRENRLPQGLDINKMDMDKLEEWLMSWKRENRPAESQGEVVYEFQDGWTIQRLTTPEQLQFEGDEMGHCVGGYSGAVDSGSSHIYSLRDRKGNPHVTMEISGKGVFVPGGKVGDPHTTPQNVPHSRAMPRFESADDRQAYEEATASRSDDSWSAEKSQQNEERWPSYWHTMQTVGPHTIDHEEDYRDLIGLPATKEFEVEQVQGQGNTTPKPEYAAKIKEFIEHLKSQGMEFERSEGWYPNQDNAGIDDWDDPDANEVYSADDLDTWWGQYRHSPEQFTGDTYDKYGIKRPPNYGSGDFDSVLADFLDLDGNGTQPGKESVEEWARELYHWATLQNYTSAHLLRSLEHAKTEIDNAADREWEMMQDNDMTGVPYPSIDEFQDPDTEDKVMEKYFRELNEAENKWWEEEWGDRWKLVQYLEAILINHGVVDKHQLPSPHAPIGGKGGIPSYAQYMEAGQTAEPTQTPFTWGTFSKVKTADWEPESDPGFLYVYYMSELHVVPWEVNLRYENMLRDLFDKFGVDMNNVLLDVDTSDVDAGEIRIYNAAPHVTHKQLCKPEVREHAEDAILEWWAGEERMRHHDWWREDEWQPLPQSINAG